MTMITTTMADDDTDVDFMLQYDGNVIIVSVFDRQFIHFRLRYYCLQ